MNFLTIIIAIFVVAGLVFHFMKLKLPAVEKVLITTTIVTFLLCIVIVILRMNEYQLTGKYTEAFIGFLFPCSTSILFGLTGDRRVKIFTGIVFVPSLISVVGSIVFKPLIFLLLIPALIFQPPKHRFILNDQLNADVKMGGFMACGENITIVASKNFFVNKTHYLSQTLCLRGINKIEMNRISMDSIQLVIFHDNPERAENPYKYTLQWKE